MSRTIRVLMGAFTASPLSFSLAKGEYVNAELIEEKSNGVGQRYVALVCPRGLGDPLWVFESYIHPDDRKTLR